MKFQETLYEDKSKKKEKELKEGDRCPMCKENRLVGFATNRLRCPKCGNI